MTRDVRRVRRALAAPIGGAWTLPDRMPIKDKGRADCPYDVALVAELDGDRYVIVELTATRRAGGPPVDTDGLRRVPVGRILADNLRSQIGRWEPSPSAEGEFVLTRPAASDDELEQVAAEYRLAHACGLPPTKTVGAVLGIPQSTAAKKVMRARERGLLDPTTPGKAGG